MPCFAPGSVLEDLSVGSAGAQLIGTGNRTHPDPRGESACKKGSNINAHDWPEIPYLTASGGSPIGRERAEVWEEEGRGGQPEAGG